jgi:ribosomal protein L7Ae-like RNA K-turn-binding protein
MAYVGLAFRAGRALAGTAACEKGVKSRDVYLLLMQRELSEGTKEKFLRICERNGTMVRTVEEPGAVGRAIGRPEVMLVGLTDKGLAEAARGIIDGVKGRIE